MTKNLNRFYRAPEKEVVQNLLNSFSLTMEQNKRIQDKARQLVKQVRCAHEKASSIDRLMTKYPLSSKEGLALMALAESLIRVPDHATAYALIQDKMKNVFFSAVVEKKTSILEKTTDQLLKLTSSFLKESHNKLLKPLKFSVQSLSKPIVSYTGRKLVNILANQFVMGDSIEGAYKKVQSNKEKGYSHSFDMLGEAACTKEDAKRYFDAYFDAIGKIGHEESQSKKPNHLRSSISVKLSALHPRYEVSQWKTCVQELTVSLKELCSAAKQHNIDLTVDAEESDRLEMSLEIFSNVAEDPDLKEWNGLGLAVQAYQKRALDVLDHIQNLSKETGRKIKVRLVKGAYWDTEIKRAQELGLEGYPVFTRKKTTDISYLACAQKLLQAPESFYPQFATHNAHSVASILEMASALKLSPKNFEFQCLFGMGQELYEQLLSSKFTEIYQNIPVRIYAPVGKYKDLLPYLVRRLLENGANSSFVNEVTRPNASMEHLIADPRKDVSYHLKEGKTTHPKIQLPSHILPGRLNSRGMDITERAIIKDIQDQNRNSKQWVGNAIISGKEIQGKESKTVVSPVDAAPIGVVYQTSGEPILKALEAATTSFKTWSKTSVRNRAKCLYKLADLIQENEFELMTFLSKEAGKSIPDGISEVREAVDFCRYYANEARDKLATTLPLPGPTGERNVLSLKGRGTFLCISPWNFPLAIFTGQIVAALVSGNTVLAKPASQTILIATFVIKLMHKAGIPVDVVHLIPASGRVVGDVLLPDVRISGVCFTGSTKTAWHINKTLAARKSAIIPFIAETGGQNAMLVDSTALAEQVVSDVIASAFQSAGQRCSALRLLLLQEEVADQVLEMLKGAMKELQVGDTGNFNNDVGPVIDQPSQESLLKHINALKVSGATEIYTIPLVDNVTRKGYFVPPSAYELSSLDALTEEHFGPILHVMRYKINNLDEIIEQVNGLGFGLTFGIHSRIESRINEIVEKINAGNIYVNRNLIGAVVGVQPFGGQGLSGTGPKAGGPHYLMRFVHEKTISVDTTAQGGNTHLMTLES